MDATDLNIVICSKNRPMQLYALLESIETYTNFEKQNISIVYRYDEEYMESLYEVMSKYNEITYIFEYDFEAQIKEIIQNSDKKYSMFLMDDQIIKENIEISSVLGFIENSRAFCFSLRLGENTTYCYPISSNQGLPRKINYVNDKYMLWDFKEGLYDWNYPLSLDGHIILTEHWKQMLSEISFKNPNTLESNLQKFSSFIPNLCACFKTSKTVNLPINKVQQENNNRHGNINEKLLLEKFKENKKIDVNKIFGIKTNAAHQEINLDFINRN